MQELYHYHRKSICELNQYLTKSLSTFDFHHGTRSKEPCSKLTFWFTGHFSGKLYPILIHRFEQCTGKRTVGLVVPYKVLDQNWFQYPLRLHVTAWKLYPPQQQIPIRLIYGSAPALFLGSLFSASRFVWEKDPHCSWRVDQPESGW